MKKTPEIEEKINALDRSYEEKDFGNFLYEAIGHAYYLEDRDSQEGELQDVAGFDDEEKALDHLLEAGSKYGSWSLYKWDAASKKWLFCKLKRKGKSIDIKWVPSDEGDFA